MLDKATVKARVTHIELLDKITEACTILDGIDEEAYWIGENNYKSRCSTDPKARKVACSEISKRLGKINERYQELNRVFREMDEKTLELLKDSV